MSERAPVSRYAEFAAKNAKPRNTKMKKIDLARLKQAYAGETIAQ